MTDNKNALVEQEPVERLDGHIENKLAPSIFVDANIIAADIWPSLVEATQADYRERGLLVGKRGNRVIRSRIFEGFREERSQDDPEDDSNEVLPSAFIMPLLPFGLRSLLPGVTEVTAIHARPMPPDLDHVQTTPISDDDVQIFVNSAYSAMLGLDRGGAHLLVRTAPDKYGNAQRNLNQSSVVETARREVVEQSGGSMDVMRKVANRLSSYGLGYFYTPDISQDGATVEFQNLGLSDDLANP